MSERETGTDSDRENDGIEITPAMIAAGRLEFADRDRWGENEDDAVARIYRAMELVRRRGWKAFWSRYAKETA